MRNDCDEKISRLKSAVSVLRTQWYDVRAKMHVRKEKVLSLSSELSVVRRDREYTLLRKQKKRLSKEIRHLEQKINRAIARRDKEVSKRK